MVTEMMLVEHASTSPISASKIRGFWQKRLVSNQRVISRKALILRGNVRLSLRRATGLLRWSQTCPFWDVKTGLDQEQLNVGDGRWTKGQSGNPAGRSKRRRLFDDHLREALSAKRGAIARRLVERLVGEAAKGNVQALKLICERIGGKPRTAEDAAVANGDELTLEQVRTKLAALLSRPEVRSNLQALLAGSDEPKTDVVQ
jgi:hypothetical protein